MTPPPNSHRLNEALESLLTGVETELLICAPFLDLGFTTFFQRPLREAAQRGVTLRALLQIADPENPRQRYIHALRWLQRLFGPQTDVRISVETPPGEGILNATAIVTDRKRAYIGSGGLHFDALTSQFEMGILTSDPELLDPLLKQYFFIMDKAEALCCP